MLLNYRSLVNQFKANVTGIVHVGGHTGEEFDAYRSSGVENLIAFEPQKWCYDKMCEEAERQGYGLDNMYQKALGSSAGTVEMYCNPDGASSSLLKPKLHLQVSPDVIFDTRETVEVITLDSLLEDGHPYNFINMDVQGFELEVLKGASKTLDKVKYVYSEVNTVEMYEGCVLIDQLDSFLINYDLVRVRTGLHGSQTWGDGFYIKSDLI